MRRLIAVAAGLAGGLFGGGIAAVGRTYLAVANALDERHPGIAADLGVLPKESL